MKKALFIFSSVVFIVILLMFWYGLSHIVYLGDAFRLYMKIVLGVFIVSNLFLLFSKDKSFRKIGGLFLVLSIILCFFAFTFFFNSWHWNMP
jgi:hypothetical protein